MRFSDRPARIVGVVVGILALVVAMNVYLLLPIRQSFATAWAPYIAAWAVYRLVWSKLSVLQRCPGGCGARIYYRVARCPRCLTPLLRRDVDPGVQALHDDLRVARVARTERG